MLPDLQLPNKNWADSNRILVCIKVVSDLTHLLQNTEIFSIENVENVGNINKC